MTVACSEMTKDGSDTATTGEFVLFPFIASTATAFSPSEKGVLHDSGLLGGVCIYSGHHYLQKWAMI